MATHFFHQVRLPPPLCGRQKKYHFHGLFHFAGITKSYSNPNRLDEFIKHYQPASQPSTLLPEIRHNFVFLFFVTFEMLSVPSIGQQDYTQETGEELVPLELKQTTLRRGKWTTEEENYTARIIHDFSKGTLDVADGTTLRNYLSSVLRCSPMRITKKFTGDGSIGKRVFTALPRDERNTILLDQAQGELRILRRLWLERMLRYIYKHLLTQ